MAPHSSTLAWKSPWTEEPGRLQSMESLRVGQTKRLHFHFSLSCIGEGNGNPLQCSYLENPGDRGAWWAAVYGVAQGRTRLKQLSSSILYSDFLVLYLISLICSRLPIPISHYIVSHHVSLGSSRLWQYLRHLLLLMILTIWKNTTQVFCRFPSTGFFLIFSSHD